MLGTRTAGPAVGNIIIGAAEKSVFICAVMFSAFFSFQECVSDFCVFNFCQMFPCVQDKAWLYRNIVSVCGLALTRKEEEKVWVLKLWCPGTPMSIVQD